MDRQARKLGRFYTPVDVAEELVSMIDERPHRILDLGCGGGALSLSAVKRWGDQVDLITVDVDADAGPRAEQWSRQHQHFRSDVLFTDPFQGLLEPEAFDLTLLNPPYGRDRDAKALVNRCRATVFMLHALRATRSGGVVAAILPETLATSAASASSRAAISRHASIERLAVLPARTFFATEARTVMAILRRTLEKPSDGAPWWSADSRLACHKNRNLTALGDLGVEVVRGRLNTVEARKAGAFHLDGFRAAKNGAVWFDVKPRPFFDERSAREGDILVARVGRDIHEKIARVSSGVNAISDCVFRVRCPLEHSSRVWAGLRSEAGRDQLRRAQAGLTARYLPMDGLLSIGV